MTKRVPKGIKIAQKNILEQIRENKSRIESPAVISGVDWFDVGSFGAFSFSRGGWFGSVRSIGRFCSLAPGLVVGPTEHKTSILTTSTFLNSANWDSEEATQFRERNAAYIRPALQLMRDPKTRNRQGVQIGNDVWIGQGAVIRKGVTIGDGAVIGANSVVSRNVEPYEVVSGVPAQSIRFRFDEETIEDLRIAQWWDFSLGSLDGIKWAHPALAAKELRRRRECGLFELAVYAILDVNSSDGKATT